MDQKSIDLIKYIIALRQEATITEIVKLCYLVDLGYVREVNNKISSFDYIRFHYGPYDSKIISCTEQLLNENSISFKVIPTPYGEQYYKYSLNEDIDVDFASLSSEEKEFIDGMLIDLAGFRGIELTKLTYETKPMKKFKAKLGGREHLGELLDMDA